MGDLRLVVFPDDPMESYITWFKRGKEGPNRPRVLLKRITHVTADYFGDLGKLGTNGEKFYFQIHTTASDHRLLQFKLPKNKKAEANDFLEALIANVLELKITELLTNLEDKVKVL